MYDLYKFRFFVIFNESLNWIFYIFRRIILFDPGFNMFFGNQLKSYFFFKFFMEIWNYFMLLVYCVSLYVLLTFFFKCVTIDFIILYVKDIGALIRFLTKYFSLTINSNYYFISNSVPRYDLANITVVPLIYSLRVLGVPLGG
jgi:hypothetical protein